MLFRSKGTEISEHRVGLDDLIVMPNVKNGMAAVLFCQGDQPKWTYTFGAELWDGVFEGFVIQKAAEQS